MEEVVKRVSEDVNGPAARAMKVYNHLKTTDFTNWDLVCFAGEYLGSMASSLPWLTSSVKSLLRLIYMAHYVRFENVSWLDQQISDGDSESETGSDGGLTSGR